MKIVENSSVATREHMKKKRKKKGKRDLKSEKRQVKRKTGKAEERRCVGLAENSLSKV